jgi:hypothetical protein
MPGWFADELFARQDFDNDHRRTTVWADEGRLDGFFRRISISTHGFRISRDNVQQVAHSRKIIVAPEISEQPIVADTMKAAGQNVQQEATDKLVGSERHGFMPRLALGSVVFPTERDTLLVQGNQA